MDNPLAQDTRVFFHLGNLHGEGKIVGIAANLGPVFGRSYIIEPRKSIVNEVYPYSHFALSETQFEVLDKTDD